MSLSKYTIPALLILGFSGGFGGCGAAGNSGATTPEAQLPITRVVLYQNGVGYFERNGKLKGNLMTLQIRPSQINDLLKSLTVIDRNDGRAMSVSLPLEKTSAQILSELPEQVRGAGGLLDVLRVFVEHASQLRAVKEAQKDESLAWSRWEKSSTKSPSRIGVSH